MADCYITRRGGTTIGAKGGGLFFGVELPRSVYYAQAAEWTEITASQPVTGGLQCVCGGNLWVIVNGTAYCISLTTGEVLETVGNANFNFTYGGNYCTPATDGEQNIWFTTGYIGASATLGSAVTRLHQFNVITKSVTFLGEMKSTSGTQIYFSTAPCGLAYSKFHNCVVCPGVHYHSAAQNSYVMINPSLLLKYDLTNNKFQILTGAGPGQGHSYGFSYSDEQTGLIYFGGGTNYPGLAYANQPNLEDKAVPGLLCFDPSNNTITTVSSTFSLSPLVKKPAWFTLGDTMFRIETNSVIAFNPKTGQTVEGELPLAPNIHVSTGMSGVANNTLYISVANSFKKCVFYEDLPANSPIVCKIYKGQKYHTIIPFTIPDLNLNITTQQQVASQDIEIKMYQYSAAGGQVIYIET